MKSLSMALVVFLLSFSVHSDSRVSYWTGERLKQSDTYLDYTSAMHTKFSDISSRYQENGEFFYSGIIDSFGQKDVLNTQQQMVFCGPGDQTFSDTIAQIALATSKPGYSHGNSLLKHDSTSIGFTPEKFREGVRLALINNANQNAMGRFCYDELNVSQRVYYRDPEAASAVYCDPSDQPSLDFTDYVSSESCSLDLDVPLKTGETRFIRQLQDPVFRTVAQGFVGCYPNSINGAPELVLIDNPSTCSKTNRSDCNHVCEWADQVVCNPVDMPNWGTCRAEGTLLFKDDVIHVTSSDRLSVSNNGELFRGEATLACTMVGEQANWVLTNAQCDQVDSNN